MPGLPVFALVDKDQGSTDDPDWVIPWPVAMVENLLLDEGAMWSVLAPQRELAGVQSAADIKERLLRYADAELESEIRLRVRSLQKTISSRVQPVNQDDLAAAVSRARDSLEEQLRTLDPEGGLHAEWLAAEATVQAIVDEHRTLEAFRGKPIFDA